MQLSCGLVLFYLCILIIHLCNLIESRIKNEDNKFIIYDPKTGRELTSIIAENIRVKSENTTLVEIPDSWNPCACLDSSCICCLGIRFGESFNNNVCISLRYTAIDYSLQLRILHNSRTIAQFELSARNPPAYCVPILMPLPFFACIRFYNIRALEGKLQVCLAVLLNVLVETIFELNFECIRFGLDGVIFIRHEQIELEMSLEDSKTNESITMKGNRTILSLNKLL